MELNHYRLIFNNKLEYLIETELDSVKSVLGHIRGGLFNKSVEDVFQVQLKEGDPVYLFSFNLFSVQKVKESSISQQTRRWKLL